MLKRNNANSVEIRIIAGTKEEKYRLRQTEYFETFIASTTLVYVNRFGGKELFFFLFFVCLNIGYYARTIIYIYITVRNSIVTCARKIGKKER